MQPWEWWNTTKRGKYAPELQVYIRLSPEQDEWSTNLIDGVTKIRIPDPEWDSVGGVVPDLILYGKDDRPIRIVEVVVTNPPSASKHTKLDRLRARGVDVVIVNVRNEKDLLELLPPLKPVHFPQHPPKTHPVTSHPNGLDGLTNMLISASPAERRRFLHVLQQIMENRPDALYPTSTRLVEHKDDTM